MRRTSSSAGLSSNSSMLHRFHADHNDVSMTSQDISRSQSTSHISRKFQQNDKKDDDKLSIFTNLPGSKDKRRSHLQPVRDEEAEAQRKARSRRERQARRSTQGVTLDVYEEAKQ